MCHVVVCETCTAHAAGRVVVSCARYLSLDAAFDQLRVHQLAAATTKEQATDECKTPLPDITSDDVLRGENSDMHACDVYK